MAITVTVQNRLGTLGQAFVAQYLLTGDASYVAGGYPITAAQLGLALAAPFFFLCEPAVDSVTGVVYTALFDYVNMKVKFLYPQGGDGVTNTGAGRAAVGASTATPAVGATAVTSTSAQPAIPVTFGVFTQDTAPAKEVQATRNLANVTCKALVIGA